MPTLLYSMPLTLKQATADPSPRWRLLDTHGQIWVIFLWGHCSFLRHPGAHKVLFVHSKSLFPQSCVSSGGSMVGLVVTFSKKTYAIPKSAAPRAPAAGHCWPVPSQETLRHGSGSGLWVGHAFCALPRSEHLSNQVLGKHTVPGGLCILISSQVLAIRSPRCTMRAPSQVCCMSPLESWSQAATLLNDISHPGSQEDVVSSWEPAHSLVEDAISGAEIVAAPCLLALALPLGGEGLVGSQLPYKRQKESQKS